MSESPTNNTARLHKATPAPAVTVIMAAQTIELPSREMLLQLRQGLLIQLKAINRMLGLDKSIEPQKQKS